MRSGRNVPFLRWALGTAAVLTSECIPRTRNRRLLAGASRTWPTVTGDTAVSSGRKPRGRRRARAPIPGETRFNQHRHRSCDRSLQVHRVPNRSCIRASSCARYPSQSKQCVRDPRRRSRKVDAPIALHCFERDLTRVAYDAFIK